MDALNAKDVCRRYGSQKVLGGLSLTMAPGRFEALMGPSGSGKSTFLHIAAGLLSPDSGSVSVGGTEVASLSDSAAARFRRRHVGVVFQAFNLLGGKSVRDNILLPLALDGAARGADARLSALVEALGLVDALGKRPEQLSGGEQQRVAIARALIADPDVVLADEPTGNLDIEGTRRICELLRGLNATEKSAILLVTHDPVVAACAQAVHFLKYGRIVASHDPEGDPARVSELYLETYR